MYIIETEDKKAIKIESWAECPSVKISSLILLSPDLKNKIKIEGFGSYVCMKEALMTQAGFKIVANICYAFNKRYAVKFRITDTENTSTLIENNLILGKSINKSTLHHGAKGEFVI
jgi:hypothetical protein